MILNEGTEDDDAEDGLSCMKARDVSRFLRDGRRQSLGKANDHDGGVVGAEFAESVLDELFGGLLWILDVADPVDCFLVLCHVPKLVNEGMSATSDWQFVGTVGTYAIACNDEEAVFATEHGLGSVGRADDKLFHIGVSERPCDGKHSVDAVVHHEASGVRDALRLLSVRALVVVRETNGLAIPTVERQRSVSNVSVYSE